MEELLKNPARVEEFLELILSALNDLIEYELAVILKIKDNGTLTVMKAMGPLSNKQLSNYVISLDERQDIAEIIKSGKPYLFREDENHKDTYEDILKMPNGHSCLVAPLKIDDYLVGMLTLDHRSCNMFSPGIVRFIGTISQLISIILVQGDSSALLLEQQRILTEERNLLLKTDSSKFEGVIGNSPQWKSVLESVRIVAGSDVSVLIQGDTGTGKEEIAGLIHRLSPREKKPFIVLNCSTLTPSLAESALFGHEKGAFTNAYTQRKGHFELADGGTLFLDEIGDLPLEIQPKLLRAVQEGCFKRVGGEKDIYADVRIIVASHIDLASAVQKKEFREDLYYRIGVFPIYLPPLRKRQEDVILLAEYFLDILRKKKGNERLRLGKDAVEYLLRYNWPGNVRELQNTIHRATLLSGGGIIKEEHLYLKKDQTISSNEKSSSINIQSLDLIISQHIKKALEKTNGKIYGKDGAAAILGVKPTTLQSKMKKMGIKTK